MDPADLALIVITHGHIDRFGSAEELPLPRGADRSPPASTCWATESGRITTTSGTTEVPPGVKGRHAPAAVPSAPV
ncbi:hypothetical protein [Streptomyces sp. NPDC085665]|uniref:hypothetical protein n=1 Tax=Streptomyces sp. NPDC085665 TaxID=3365735 RepID=UPI0037D2BDD8